MSTTSFTGKSLSEALIFASTNPQYDYRLFIELPGENMLCTEIVSDIHDMFVYNMFSPCSAKRRAPDKDLPVLTAKLAQNQPKC